MPTLEDQITTPFGAGFVRLSGARGGLRLVRRTVDQSELDIAAGNRVDQVELIQAVLDEGALQEDDVVFSVGFDAPVTRDSDDGTSSLDFHVSDGGLSLCVLDDSDLEHRRGVTLMNPYAEDNAAIARAKMTFAQALEAGLIKWSPPEPMFILRVSVAPPGGFLTAAFAWKRAKGFSHETDHSVYSAAERAAFILG